MATKAEKIRNEKLSEAGKPYRWPKGYCPNPNPPGRPKGWKKLAKIMRDQLQERASLVPSVCKIAEDLGLDPEMSTIGAVLALASIDYAVRGDSLYAKEVFNRNDGIVSQLADPIDDPEEDDPQYDQDLVDEQILRAIKRKRDGNASSE